MNSDDFYYFAAAGMLFLVLWLASKSPSILAVKRPTLGSGHRCHSNRQDLKMKLVKNQRKTLILGITYQTYWEANGLESLRFLVRQSHGLTRSPAAVLKKTQKVL